MKIHFLILLIAIISISEEKNQFGNEYTKNFQQKVSKFIAFIKPKTYKSMFDYILSKNKWIEMVENVKIILEDYEEEEGEEEISYYSEDFCNNEDLEMPNTSKVSCNNFVKDFYSCMLHFPFCLNEIISN